MWFKKLTHNEKIKRIAVKLFLIAVEVTALLLILANSGLTVALSGG